MRRDRGQLAIGLAGAFAMTLAIFGMILRSGFITREKMKMQQTSDFAAMVAAREQKYYLNRIHNLNSAIEEAFRFAQDALLTPPSPCFAAVYQLSPTAPYPTIQARAELLSATYNPFSGPVHLRPGQSPCDVACEKFDRLYRNSVIMAYQTLQGDLSQKIYQLIGEANQRAYQASLDTFLEPQNLPFGLALVLGREHNVQNTRELTRDMVKADYEQGALKDAYEVIDWNKSQPLFRPDGHAEIRTFKFMNFNYPTIVTPFSGPMCELPTPSLEPGLAPTMGKVGRDGDVDTTFFSGVVYNPAKDLEGLEKFKLRIREARAGADFYGKEIEEQGRKLNLFSRPGADESSDRRPMMVVSLAKPYGGKYPRGAELANPLDNGDAGEPFKGVRLVGIADKASVGGGDLSFPANGLTGLGDTQEDYLH